MRTYLCKFQLTVDIVIVATAGSLRWRAGKMGFDCNSAQRLEAGKRCTFYSNAKSVDLIFPFVSKITSNLSAHG